MEFRFLLNGIEINEPIGFDGFKPVIERTDHHGMSVSVSLSKIGFYGKAFEIIEDAYNTDIDIELPFIVQINRDGDWIPIYSGVVDLASYERVNDNGACRINCNVGEIGVKTTFNNRYDTKVELNRLMSLDDDDLPEYGMLKRNISFPSKEIIFTSSAKIKEEITSNTHDDFATNWYSMPDGLLGMRRWFFVPLGEIKTNEFEYFNSDTKISHIESIDNYDDTLLYKIPDGACSFVFLEENSKFDSPKMFNFDIQIKFDALISFSHSRNEEFYMLIILCHSDGTIKDVLYKLKLEMDNKQTISHDISYKESISMNYGEKVAVLFRFFNMAIRNDDEFYFNYSIDYTAKVGSGISITALSQSEPSSHNVSLVHESLSRLSEIISGYNGDEKGLTVKSDWYGRHNSNVNHYDILNYFGGGSLKAILNGYELRNQNLTSGERPPIKLSFKDLFESLSAIDNIGWGFWEEKESGKLYLRVERWQWFYNEDVIMTINNPNNVKRTIQANKVYTRLKTGYEKYLDEQEINAIDTFHTNREYYTGLKAVDNKLEKICKFIADPYAIEVTRRQEFNIDTTNWKYDEDIFIVALHFEGWMNDFSIDIGITDTEDGNNIATIISPDTMYNARISPQRNAIRWAERFFEAASNRNSLDYTAGTGNITAKGKPAERNHPYFADYYLEDSGVGAAISEKDNIAHKAPLLKPEILSFDYPITFEQYAAILDNPYGKIIVDGEECYIQKVTPNLIERKASFELIPKNV